MRFVLLDPAFKRVVFLLWCLGWLAVLGFGLQPSPSLPLELSDKAWHFLGYAGMTAAIAGFCHDRREVLLWAALAVLIGLMVELAQHLVPSRSMELADAVANTLGAASGTLVALAWLAVVIEPLRRRAVPA